MIDPKFLQNRDALRRRVSALPLWARAVFAATCAERLGGAYDEYCAQTGAPPVLREALNQVWDILLGRLVADREKLAANVEEWERTAIPKKGSAHHSAISILYALRTIASDDIGNESAFFAADTLFNALIANINDHLGISDYGPRYNDEVLNHANVLGEWKRQARELSLLETSVEQPDARLVEAVRARAFEERVRFLPVTLRAEPYINPFTGKRLPRG